MTDDACEEAVDRLAEDRMEHRLVTALPEDCRPADLEEGYALQVALHDRLAALGWGQRIGYKIGCTSQVMQELLGINHPCSGGLFDHSVFHKKAVCRRADYIDLGLELEIGLQLNADLPPRSTPYREEEVVDAVGAIMGSVEIVDNRYDDWRALGTPTIVADDFFSAGCVFGPPVEDWFRLDLSAESGSFFVDGEQRATGHGRDIMGHPMAALMWLVNSGTTHDGLKAGDLVTLGSLAPPLKFDGPCLVEARYDNLGSLTIEITD